MDGATTTPLRHPRRMEIAAEKPGDDTQTQTETPGDLRKNTKRIPPGAWIPAKNAPKMCRETCAS